MIEKEYTPLQALIEGLDVHIGDCKVKSYFQEGYMKGLLASREVAIRLLPNEQHEFERAFEEGRNSTAFSSGKEYSECLFKKIDFEAKKLEWEVVDESNNPWLKRTTDEDKYVLWTSPLYFRKTIFVFWFLLNFIWNIAKTVFFVITFNFEKLKKLPQKAQKEKNDFREYLDI